MALQLRNLDAATRQLMLSEIQADIDAGTLYISGRLTPEGARSFPALLEEAARAGSDATLQAALRRPGLIRQLEPRRTKNGTTQVKVPVTAAETLSEGEFNRFYIRAVCLRAIGTGQETVSVYRAKDVMNPRPESEGKIGTRVSSQRLLEDLRANPGVDTALGLPAGPNSGLSVQL